MNDFRLNYIKASVKASVTHEHVQLPTGEWVEPYYLEPAAIKVIQELLEHIDAQEEFLKEYEKAARG